VFSAIHLGVKMWLLIVWQISFTQPIVKTHFDNERECLYMGAQFEVAYKESKPIEFKCFKMGE